MIWTRRTWMRLGVVSALCAVISSLLAFRLQDAGAQSMIRLGSGFQFMHAMATIACATFIQVGARNARHAPAFFLVGSAIFSGSLYARAAGVWDGGDLALALGAALAAGGWGALLIAGADIDGGDA